MSGWVAVGVAGLVVAAVLYWLLVLTEGAYLGQRTVTALYNRFAGRYDAIKQYTVADEVRFVGEPVTRFLEFHQSTGGDQADAPALLDVACGTGRFALAVLAAFHQPCTITALDASAGMLAQARQKLSAAGYGHVVLQQIAVPPLPFAADQFVVVACLEALEFMPDQTQVLHELLRVLKPGGLLVLTNRIGGSAVFMPGRVMPSARLAERLYGAGAMAVKITPWQMDYDLLWAIKDDGSPPQAAETVLHWTI